MEEKNIEELREQRERAAHDPKYRDISYRDRISTVTVEGKRNYIHPKIPKGRFITWRNIVGLVLLALLFILPLIKVNGDPLILLDVFNRKFILFGAIFWPQDTFVMLLLMLSFILFIVLFTVTYGRIWCGWLCPQTIFLEIVFRRIESWIEGSPNKQRKLDAMPWNAEKISKRLLKWIIFYALSFAFVNAMLWFFMSFDRWWEYMTDLENHTRWLMLDLLFTTIFFLIYVWFREQICIIACPYGRMQGVLIDPSTIVISYDYLRGEPRGHQKKGSTREETGLGDCIDCYACVDVCPTGIDIRNGTQLECVNCTACIDACDNVMDRIGKPRGLIRYASEKEISSGKRVGWSPRIIAYSIVLLAILTFAAVTLFTRSDVDAVIIRTPGVLCQKAGADSLINMYNIKVVNKTRFEKDVDIKLVGHKGRVTIVGGDLLVPPEARAESILFVKIANKDIESENMTLKLAIFSDGEEIDQTEVTFMSPAKQ
jgi:cytochrome c oxidase accessory protein FixG